MLFSLNKIAKIPASFSELSGLDPDTTATLVDYEDAFRAVIRHIEDNMLDEAGKQFLKAPIEIVVPGTGQKVSYTGRVFPSQPDPRYIKFSIPAISIMSLNSTKNDINAGKVKYKNINQNTKEVTIRKISTTYVRQVQITGWWASPIQRQAMNGQLLSIFQIAQNTGRILTPKKSHVYMEFLGDRDIDVEENTEDRIYQNASTWKLSVRGFTEEKFFQGSGIKVNLKSGS